MSTAMIAQAEMESVLAQLDRDEHEQPHKVKEYTAETFRRLRPKDYELVVSGLAMGVSKHRIRLALGISWRTVRAVEQSLRPSTVAQRKRELGERCFDLAEQWMDIAESDPKLLKQLNALGAAILIDKGLAMQGEATSIVEHRHTDAATDAARRVFEHPLWMGLAGENVRAIGPAAPGLEPQPKTLEAVEIPDAGGGLPPA